MIREPYPWLTDAELEAVILSWLEDEEPEGMIVVDLGEWESEQYERWREERDARGEAA